MVHLLQSVSKLCGSWSSFLARVLVELQLATLVIRCAILSAEWMFHDHV